MENIVHLYELLNILNGNFCGTRLRLRQTLRQLYARVTQAYATICCPLLPFHLQVVQFARIGAGDDVREVDCEAGDRLRRIERAPLLEADRAPVPLRHVPTLVGGSALPLALLHEGEGSCK